MFTKEMILDYADKLLIGLSDEECQTLLEEFDVIKENMELISNIPKINEVKPMSFPTEYVISDLRDDKAKESLDINLALSNCDDYLDRVVCVPKVVGNKKEV